MNGWSSRAPRQRSRSSVPRLQLQAERRVPTSTSIRRGSSARTVSPPLRRWRSSGVRRRDRKKVVIAVLVVVVLMVGGGALGIAVAAS